MAEQTFILGTPNTANSTFLQYNPAGIPDDEFDDDFKANVDHSRFLVGVDFLPGGNLLQLTIGSSPGSSGASGEDLSNHFENNWSLSFAFVGEVWDFDHSQFVADSREPYLWVTTDSDVLSRIQEVVDAVSLAQTTAGLAVTIRDFVPQQIELRGSSSLSSLESTGRLVVDGGVVDLQGTASLGNLQAAGTLFAADLFSIIGTAITSVPQALSDTYGLGETIEISVTWDGQVDVTGNPQFPLNLGQSPTGGPEYADYLRGTGTDTIVFGWVVAATDEDTNGIFLYGDTDSQNRGDIIGGTIRNAGVPVDADRTTLNRGTQSGAKVNGTLRQDVELQGDAALGASEVQGQLAVENQLLLRGVADLGALEAQGRLVVESVVDLAGTATLGDPQATGALSVTGGAIIHGAVFTGGPQAGNALLPIALPEVNALAPAILLMGAMSLTQDRTAAITAVLSGGIYDTVEYAWSIESGGGSLAADDEAAVTYNKAAVIYNPAGVDNTEIIIRLAITVRGTGTNAKDRTMATAVVERTLTVTGATLPNAAAPALSLTDIMSIREDQAATIRSAVSGGTYDTIEYVWTIQSGGGSLDATGSSVVYTPPDVDADTQVAIRCVATARGTGTFAEDGMSATVQAEDTFILLTL